MILRSELIHCESWIDCNFVVLGDLKEELFTAIEDVLVKFQT